MENRTGTRVSPGVSKFGEIDFTKGNFKNVDSDGYLRPFNIKNETGADQELDVVPWDGTPGVYITTLFRPGWNEEVVREVAAPADTSLRFKWGD